MGTRRIVVLVTTAALMAVMAALGAPAFANCGDGDCSVGALGTGGEESEGKAQGFRFEGPGDNPGILVTNVGNADAGRLTVDRPGDDDGTLSGIYRGDSARGRGSGSFGGWAGQCEAAKFPDNC
jgi:hypothetical protein